MGFRIIRQLADLKERIIFPIGFPWELDVKAEFILLQANILYTLFHRVEGGFLGQSINLNPQG